MTFFYDLNKKLDEIRATPETTHKQLNERDMGKHNNKTTGFDALAKKAGKEYGSKAAGERVAGAQFQKMKKSGNLEEEGFPRIQAGIQKYTKPGIEKLAKLGREGASKAKMDATRKEFDQYANKEVDEGRVDDVSKSVKSIYYPDKARSPVQKFDKSTGRFDKYMGKNSPLDDKEFAPDQTSRPAGMNPDPASRYAMGEAELDEVSRGEYIKQQDTAAEKSGKQKFNAFGQTFDTDEIDEGGLPMTTVNGKKVPKFAADGQGANDLAKKKSFNDKIAGAKQEVEEMLGDVAAEAMRSALGGKKQMADEGFDDMERDVKRRLSTPKVGDVRRGARHDIETTATGIRATRRPDDETDEQPTGEKRKAGRPKGADKGPERVTGNAYKHKGGRKTNEGDVDITDRGEYDQEGDMAKDSIKTVVRHAQALEKILGDNDNLPEWVQSKLAKIESMMTAVDDYMQNQEDDDQPLDEKAVSKNQAVAARIARGVQKGEAKAKPGSASAEMAKMEPKELKKFAKTDTKGLPKKKKEVEETTTSGSVATGSDAPKASKGGMQVGKGIYDSLNRKVEGMIAESMSINVSMTKDDNGSHKNITVTASDEDAEALAQLLRSAGLGGDMSNGHAEPCPACGSTDCGCDQGMAEAYGDTDASQNEPNWPTDTEYSVDAMQYSGGLNGPKSTGQTTVPVIAHQGERTGVDDEELRRMMEMAGIQQNLKPWERTMKEAAVEEGVVDKVKDVVKKGLEKLGHGSDEDMRKDLQKKMGVPPTGKKPEDKKMEESLMKEFVNFRI